MSFELGDPKPPDEMFFEKTHSAGDRPEETGFQNDISAHKDLFETISEAHYLPELGGPHDEALLESLVEKGCEDNQILGQALDKLAHLVHGADYAEEEDDMLLGGAPVADIIDRLEQSLESPGRSSMTAAQGLLHLHHIADHLPPPEHQQTVDQTYIQDEVFAEQAPADCEMESMNSNVLPNAETNEVNHIDYDSSAEKRLENDVAAADALYTEPVPDTHDTYNSTFEEQHPQPLPDQSEMPIPNEEPSKNISDVVSEIGDIKEDIQNESNDEEMAPLEPKLSPASEEPTDLSLKHIDDTETPELAASVGEMTNAMEDNISEKSDEQPKDLSVHRRLPTPHASPRRTDVPRAPSRESDAMQSPQPSGIPAVPSSPEIFTMPPTKSKQTLFLETLLSSPSPKMYTSEVTITKQQCEPLNLGKHRKSASPTVTSCSDEIRKLNKEFGEPQEKKVKREDEIKITKVFGKMDDHVTDSKKKIEKSKSSDEFSPLRQLQILKTSPDFNIPDPLLVPRDKIGVILANPVREIPALYIQRPELRLPEAFAFPRVLHDPDIIVISLSQFEEILEKPELWRHILYPKPTAKQSASSSSSEQPSTSTSTSGTQQAETTSTTVASSSTGQPRPIPSMDALAGEIDAATTAAINQMLFLPYLSQLEAMACAQSDFLKAYANGGGGGSGNGPNYPDLSQMFNPNMRFMGPGGFPMMPPMNYDSQLQFAMWQEAMMNQANAQANVSASQRPKPNSALEAQMKEIASKSSDVQNPYVHSTKNHQNKQHSAARTSPIAHNYNNNQRSMTPFLQGMYPGMNPNIRPNMALPGLQIPYFNPNLMGASQRSPRTGQQKSPTSPYFPNNNYLQSVKQTEGQHQRSSSTSSQESPRPRISVKSLQNLLEPSAAAASGGRRGGAAAAPTRRRDEPEVGSTTPGEPPLLPPNPHDPSSFHLWHPLFGK
ncbi:uncharacterized protein LOC126371698 isoform X2 [Pectinophora gossypiella]|uniref:uncharacterized protein LOC126371698 isoform X2 n=1 Tax=Pectinophora gossypiella TaxID=13191 RepID=UPI00214F3520|nr:uncharacterized protein LOC126371698 isoform X2 [Pectinophora gossypiella]